MPPKVVVEVDIRIEAEGFAKMGYVFQKSEKLMGFGSEATNLSWYDGIHIFDSITFNIGKYPDAESIRI